MLNSLCDDFNKHQLCVLSSDDEDLPLPVKDRVHKFQQHGDHALPENSFSNTSTQNNRPKRQRPTSDAFEYFEKQGILIGSKVNLFIYLLLYLIGG